MQAESSVVFSYRFYVDANVFLRTAQEHIPDLDYICRMSRVWLDENIDNCFTGQLVFREVDHQLRTFPHQYKGAKRVRRYVLACNSLPEERRAEAIVALATAYRDEAPDWTGGTNDNDRIHAATASVFGIDYLVTWDEAFMQRKRVVERVNLAHQLRSLGFTEPA